MVETRDLVIVAGALGAFYLLSRSGALQAITQTTALSQAQAVAYWILPNNSKSTDATFAVGEPIRLATEVRGNVTPVSVQAFSAKYGSTDYKALSVHAWDVKATGMTFVINMGGATNSMVGAWTFYTVVRLADGRTLTSNKVNITVVPRGISRL